MVATIAAAVIGPIDGALASNATAASSCVSAAIRRSARRNLLVDWRQYTEEPVQLGGETVREFECGNPRRDEIRAHVRRASESR